MAKSNTMDLTRGPIMKQLVAFAIPVLLTSLMNQTFTVADRIVVGRFAKEGTQALAAVGASSLMTSLLVSLFSGLSVGVNVICANRRGAKDQDAVERCMHSAIALSVIIGIVVAALGALTARPFLEWMNTPEDIFSYAYQYIRIIFMGIPVVFLYNLTVAISRAMGDSKTIQDVDGKRTVYLYGEKTWFDTREERDAYRVERNREKEESAKRNKMLKEIMKHYEAMTTEELAEELKRMG